MKICIILIVLASIFGVGSQPPNGIPPTEISKVSAPSLPTRKDAIIRNGGVGGGGGEGLAGTPPWGPAEPMATPNSFNGQPNGVGPGETAAPGFGGGGPPPSSANAMDTQSAMSRVTSTTTMQMLRTTTVQGLRQTKKSKKHRKHEEPSI